MVDIICNLHPAVASSPAGEDAKIVPCNLSDLAEFVPWLDTVGISSLLMDNFAHHTCNSVQLLLRLTLPAYPTILVDVVDVVQL